METMENKGLSLVRIASLRKFADSREQCKTERAEFIPICFLISMASFLAKQKNRRYKTLASC
jgi:hypothetical protein